MQAPADAAGSDTLLRHAHAPQPEVTIAAAEQQQPPRQRLVLQSKALPQASPGEKVRQDPEPGAQPPQPSRTAFAEQQIPAAQRPEAQEALEAQTAPYGRKGRQAAAPGTSEKAPTLQGVQAVAEDAPEAELAVPAGQARQLSAEVAPVAAL